jgi:hypothetical protein
MPLAVILGLGLLAGCGGGDDKKSGSNASSAKAKYEREFAAALVPARSAATVVNRVNSRSSPESAAKAFDQVSAIYRQISANVRAIKAPKDIAGIHNQIGAVLTRISTDTGKVGAAFHKRDAFARTVALNDYRAQQSKLQSLGRQLTARGY